MMNPLQELLNAQRILEGVLSWRRKQIKVEIRKYVLLLQLQKDQILYCY